MNRNQCKYCGKNVLGRNDKKFCSLDCKNAHNYIQRSKTKTFTKTIDGYLHRNQEILATIIGTSTKITLDKSVLDRTGFRYDFHTSHYTNKEGKTYWRV